MIFVQQTADSHHHKEQKYKFKSVLFKTVYLKYVVIITTTAPSRIKTTKHKQKSKKKKFTKSLSKA